MRPVCSAVAQKTVSHLVHSNHANEFAHHAVRQNQYRQQDLDGPEMRHLFGGSRQPIRCPHAARTWVARSSAESRTRIKSVSNDETAKMLISASASGCAIEARIPVRAKSSGPSTIKTRQPPSDWTLPGTTDSAQTIDVSSFVPDAEQKLPVIAQPGSSEPAGRRHTDRRSGRTRRLSIMTLAIDNPILAAAVVSERKAEWRGQ
jgi:hypothetical protein